MDNSGHPRLQHLGLKRLGLKRPGLKRLGLNRLGTETSGTEPSLDWKDGSVPDVSVLGWFSPEMVIVILFTIISNSPVI